MFALPTGSCPSKNVIRVGASFSIASEAGLRISRSMANPRERIFNWNCLIETATSNFSLSLSFAIWEAILQKWNALVKTQNLLCAEASSDSRHPFKYLRSRRIPTALRIPSSSSKHQTDDDVCELISMGKTSSDARARIKINRARKGFYHSQFVCERWQLKDREDASIPEASTVAK